MFNLVCDLVGNYGPGGLLLDFGCQGLVIFLHMPIPLNEADLAIEYSSKEPPRALLLRKFNMEHSTPPMIDERFCVTLRSLDKYAKA